MSGRVARTLCSAVLAAVVAASPAVADPPAPVPSPSDAPAPAAGPAPQGVAGLLKQLQTLYQEAEEAGELYEGTEEELRERTAEAGRLRTELARAKAALDSGRRDAGRLARDQYQGSTDFSVYLRLLLADDPARALEQSHVIERAQAGRSAVVDRLTGAERHAEDLAAKSRTAQNQQRLLAERRKAQRNTVESRLKGIEAMLASLSPEQIAAVSALERKNVGEAQDALTASGALSSVRLPSAAGSEAVRFAIEQIGKPYVWAPAKSVGSGIARLGSSRDRRETGWRCNGKGRG
ncbi:glycoside hydrolase, partial [Streptomyces sp. NPDC048301]